MITKLLPFLSKRVTSRNYSTNLYFHPGFNPENMDKFADSFLIFENVISEKEEETFMKEMEPHLKRHIYEKDHWDDVRVEMLLKKGNQSNV